jgi:hypothetical protein
MLIEQRRKKRKSRDKERECSSGSRAKCFVDVFYGF